MSKKVTGKIEIIQLIRAASALMIMTYHSKIIGDIGYCGVEFFCLISGYVMMLSTEKRSSFFLLKRLYRIVPLYWLSTFVMYILICLRPDLSLMSVAKPEYLLKSMFFIPFKNELGYNKPILAIGWTLNYEVFFIVLFYCAMCFSHKYRGIVSGILITVLTVTGLFTQPKMFYLEYYTDTYILEFLYGIVLYYLIEKPLSEKNGKMTKIREKICSDYVLRVFSHIIIFMMLGWLLLDPCSEILKYRGIRLGIPAFIAVFLILLYYRMTPVNAKIVRLGDISYSFFLIEFFTTAVYKVIVDGKAYYMQFLLFLIILTVTIGLSYLSWKVIERNCVLKI